MAGMRDLQLPRHRLVIPETLLSVRFSRSGGPGGQNVNKVSSKADVRLDLAGLEPILGPDRLTLIREKLGNRLDEEGRLQIISSEHRDQPRNVESALARMETLLDGALERPRPRRATRPTRGSVERRLKEKKHRSQRRDARNVRDD
jgi:ribosome-associated protein